MNTMLSSGSAIAASESAHARASARAAARRKRLRKLAPYAFISPFFILFAVFGLFPLLFSI